MSVKAVKSWMALSWSAVKYEVSSPSGLTRNTAGRTADFHCRYLKEAVSQVFNGIGQQNKILIKHSVGGTSSHADTYTVDFQNYILIFSRYGNL